MGHGRSHGGHVHSGGRSHPGHVRINRMPPSGIDYGNPSNPPTDESEEPEDESEEPEEERVSEELQGVNIQVQLDQQLINIYKAKVDKLNNMIK
jgi:hypothetical protein